MDILVQQVVNGLVLGSMYALVALGYSMVYGVLNLINFAHGDILMVGAMVGVTVVHACQAHGPPLPGLLVLLLAMLAAVPACVVVNLLIERIAYRPLRHAPRLAPLISAIGSSVVLQTLAMLVFGRNPIIFPLVLSIEPYHLWGALISPTQVLTLILAAVLMAGLVLLVERTRAGRAMRAVAENPRIAGLMGIDAVQVVRLAFALGAALAGVAGVMWGATYSTTHFSMGFLPGLKAFSCAVLGGIGHLQGAVLGGLLLGLIESIAGGYLGPLTGGVLGSQYQDIFAFLVLIGVLALRPSGLLGQRGHDRV
ncbi:branched-chain amino acid ABC transporter permease [uncultured Aquincola sp.]|uniref:branched-chain amino acid ABC transporter permease n=1 Tax=uncultured Aquincola sp. TaxID=886556 RepID=UPI0032B1A3D5|tara:strand:+ start:219 stop:1148 length:930 start_codon:yes stop_codon:yes gene_type:complete